MYISPTMMSTNLICI